MTPVVRLVSIVAAVSAVVAFLRGEVDDTDAVRARFERAADEKVRLTVSQVEKRVSEALSTIQAYSVAGRATDPDPRNEDLQRALLGLASFYGRVHRGGRFPVVQKLDVEIEVDVLPIAGMDSVKTDHRIPEGPPNGSQWRWFHVSITNRWNVRPIYPGGEPSKLHPRAFIDPVVVMGSREYRMAIGRHNAEISLYTPLSVASGNESVEALRSVRYLGKGNSPLHYKVTKHYEQRGTLKQKGPVSIELAASLTCDSDQTEREEIASKLFPDLVEARDVFPTVSAGLLEVYEVPQQAVDSDDTQVVEIELPEEETCYWAFEALDDYVLPAKIVADGVVLQNLQIYIVPFNRVCTLNRLRFKSQASEISFTRRLRPIVDAVPLVGWHHPRPSPIPDDATRDEQLRGWEVLPTGEFFFFPGNSVIFQWEDTLIQDLLSE